MSITLVLEVLANLLTCIFYTTRINKMIGRNHTLTISTTIFFYKDFNLDAVELAVHHIFAVMHQPDIGGL